MKMHKANISMYGVLVAAGAIAACAGSSPAPSPAHSPPPASHSASTTSKYPPTRRTDAKDVFHGVVVSDPYRWLEDGDSPEVKAWSKAQDGIARKWLDAIPSRAEFIARNKEVMYAGADGLPVRAGSQYFYRRRGSGQEKYIVYRRDVRTGIEHTLIDPTTWSEKSLALQGYWPSADGRKLVYKASRNGADLGILRVLDVETGTESAVDTIEPVGTKAPEWSGDGLGFYYRLHSSDANIQSNEQKGRVSVRYHRLGTDPKHDVVIREPTLDSKIYENVTPSRDGRWLILKVEIGDVSADFYLRDSKHPLSPWMPLSVGRDAKREMRDYNGVFFLQTNDDAVRGRIVRVDPAHPARENWKEVVAERKDASLQTFRVAGGKLLIQWNKDATNELEVRDLDGTNARPVKLPTLGGVFAGGDEAPTLSARPEDDEAFFQFESYATPPVTYSLSIKSNELRVWSKVSLPKVDPSEYVVERIFYSSKDGTRVPMFVVHRRDVPLDGRAPVMMKVYGGFGSSVSPYFYPGNYTWVERGGVFVDPAIRGGGEYGNTWHRAGMLTNKQNTFDDVIAAAEDLIKRGWARASRMGIRGTSNGGLTAAAVIVERPDLFRAAICSVPVIDVIRSPLFGNGKEWETEYGTPEDAEQFKAMFAYSPYHRIEAGKRYPSLLIQSADSDDRVDPMHARKFAAAMQAVATDRPVLLKIRENTSHFGSDLVSANAEYQADMDAFLLSEMDPF